MARMDCGAAGLWSAAKRYVCDVVMHCLSESPNKNKRVTHISLKRVLR